MNVKVLLAVIIGLLISFSTGIGRSEARDEVLIYKPNAYHTTSPHVRYQLRTEKRSRVHQIFHRLLDAFKVHSAPSTDPEDMGFGNRPPNFDIYD